MEPLWSLLDGSFGEARDLKKAATDGGIASGIEGGGGLWLVRGDGGNRVEIGARADRDFDIVKSPFGFDDAVPAKRRTGFGESSDSTRQFAAVRAGFQGGDGAAVINEAHDEVKNQCGERERSAEPAARPFRAGADFFRDQPAEQGEKNSREENCEDPKIERWQPIHGKAAGRERPQEFDARALQNIHEEMKKSRGQRGDEDCDAGSLIFSIFWLEGKKRKSDEETEKQCGKKGVKVGAIESEVGGGAEVGAQQIEVSEGSGDDDGKRNGTGDAWEGGALQDVGGQGVGDGVHGRSYLMKSERDATAKRNKRWRRWKCGVREPGSRFWDCLDATGGKAAARLPHSKAAL